MGWALADQSGRAVRAASGVPRTGDAGQVLGLLPWIYAPAIALMVYAMWDVRQIDGGLSATSRTCRALGTSACGLLVGRLPGVRSRVRGPPVPSGDERRALQIRWVLLAGSIAVVVLLVSGWVAEAFGASITAAYAPFGVAIVLLVPAAVGIAMVRHDLFDVDRILGAGGSWVLTLVVSAAVFGGVVSVVSRSLGAVAGPRAGRCGFHHRACPVPAPPLLRRPSSVGLSTATGTSRSLRSSGSLPTSDPAGNRPRTSSRCCARHKVIPTATGPASPRRTVVTDDGEAVEPPDGIRVEVGGDTIAVVTLGWESARARGRVTDLTRAAWVTIEVSRLRQVLREALEEVVSSQARLGEAAAQSVDAWNATCTMALSSDRRYRDAATRPPAAPDGAAADEVGTAVAELEETVRELRDIAHGVRPVRLSDGLVPRSSIVRATSPVPLTLSVTEPRAWTRTVASRPTSSSAEAVTNALKHAAGHRIDVDRGQTTTESSPSMCATTVSAGCPSSGLTALRDRVRSVGGRLSVTARPASGPP